MSGWEVARQVRGLVPHITIILTSGWGKDFNKEQLAKHGVDYVLPKPVTLSDLQDLVRQIAQGQPLSIST